jgi:hypothetical protein
MRPDRHRETDVMKLIVAILRFSNGFHRLRIGYSARLV